MSLSRRDVLAMSTAAVAALRPAAKAAMPPIRPSRSATASTPARSAARSCRSTEEVEIAAKAGYDAIEPWIGEIEDVREGAARLKDLGKRIADLGLKVESSIGFAEWIVNDDAAAAEGPGRGQARHGHGAGQVGGKRIAAPPAGATRQAPIVDLLARRRPLPGAAANSATKIGVVAEVEVWGFSKTLSTARRGGAGRDGERPPARRACCRTSTTCTRAGRGSTG